VAGWLAGWLAGCQVNQQAGMGVGGCLQYYRCVGPARLGWLGAWNDISLRLDS
jgi:hypothetical protein